MAVAKDAERIVATKVHAGKLDFVLSLDFAFVDDTNEEQVLSLQRGLEEETSSSVCMVLSPSEHCDRDPFTALKLTRTSLLMRFNREGRRTFFGVPSLRIEFSVGPELWRKMARTLETICEGKSYYVSPEAG